MERVLIVTPASLKSEWEDRSRGSPRLPCQTLSGRRPERLAGTTRAGADFHMVNYEKMVTDALEVNDGCAPKW